MLERFKEILKLNGITGKEFAKIHGLNYIGYRSATRSGSDNVPKWVRSFVNGYDLGKKHEQAKNIEVSFDKPKQSIAVEIIYPNTRALYKEQKYQLQGCVYFIENAEDLLDEVGKVGDDIFKGLYVIYLGTKNKSRVDYSIIHSEL